ncbi:hypothetical protein DRW41_04135 [Neobacillus piezotolerans]|uniref:Uncharacterized protein n=1 Tax=Neobacillus piezotolerans TaxID=2259171 RepID=A0A3D8GXG3_9BACI|nr:hypothetical protein [Neobacillus piezotolerans]RDU38756.1 hypothetical protein DRW41_04135 [Neobacillus piezotolerans]
MANFFNLNSTSINLPYIYENLIVLLTQIIKGKNNFSDYDFAQWCDNFTIIFEDDEVSKNTEHVLLIAGDIECQWDLFLVNTYSIEELQKMDLT